VVTFPVAVPANFTAAEVMALLTQQGYDRVHDRDGATLHVIQDRLQLTEDNRGRLTEALEAAMKVGHGRVDVHVQWEQPHPLPETWRFSADLHCPRCDIHYRDASPNLFSFNSPVGAC